MLYCAFLADSFLEAEGIEKTCKIKQRDISEVVDVASASKVCSHFSNLILLISTLPQIFDLKLDKFGLYSISYTRNGR